MSLPIAKRRKHLFSTVLLVIPVLCSIYLLLAGGENWLTDFFSAATSSMSPVPVPAVSPSPAAPPDLTDTAVKTTDIPRQKVAITVHAPTTIQSHLDGKKTKEELLYPREYEFTFLEEGKFIIYNTSAVTVSFNGEKITNLARLGKKRTVVFRANKENRANN